MNRVSCFQPRVLCSEDVELSEIAALNVLLAKKKSITQVKFYTRHGHEVPTKSLR